jgi:hypothetical protein
MQDQIPTEGYTLLKLGNTKVNTVSLEQAIAGFKAPLTVLEVPDRVARDIYGFDLILLRPDMHIVWRGQQLPEDVAQIAAVATGH